MATHHLQTEHKYFQDAVDDKKDFEVRFNDRDYQVGDNLVLLELEPDKLKTNVFTGRRFVATVKYILTSDCGYGLKEGWVIMGLNHIPF